MIFEKMEFNRALTIIANKSSSLCWCLALVSLLLWASHADAQTRTFTFKHGAVMARSLALDENKQPILVEYNEQGEEVNKVPIPSEYSMDVAKLKVITAFEYHQEKLRLDKFEELHKNDLWKDAEVMSLDKFRQTEFVSADGKTSIAVPTLPSYVKSVLVRGRSARINPDPQELVLLSFSVDLSEEKAVPEKGSLVINDKGQVIYTSSNNIAPRVGFFGDPNEKQDRYFNLRKPDDEIYGPVKYVKVFISPEAYPGSMTSSDFRGKYSMSFMLPYCPGGMEYTTDIWAELRYANFSPYGSATIPYYLRRQDWTYCYDLPPFVGTSLGAAAAYMNAMASLATMAIPLYNADFRVDVMFLSGRILLRNPDGSAISVGNDTQYHVASANNTTQAQAFYDFDGDGKSDLSVVGDIKDEVQPDGTVKKVFVQQNNGPYQGVYFSSQKKPDGTPNVIRLADKGDRLKPNGLLKSISKDDLKNTDIYVFRESTGQLVLERNGLKDEEIAGRVDIGLGKNDQYYYYRLMLRGPMDSAINVGGINRGKNWEEWAEEYRLAEPFRKRESDYLKSGEWVRLVVINRATGYMGTQRIQLGDASKNAGSTLSVKLDDIWLQPPNLKIWAERDYTQTSGLEQNKQQKNNIIGMEGASLDSDDIIRVYTEWLDEEGRPLPEGLSADNGEQYGLTGRLAKVGSPNQLVSVAAGSLASFAIAPGMNTQVLRLKDNLTAPEHFYVHVVGMQKDENPDFGTDPTEAPPLDTRPKNATPFLVPIYDENKHWQTWSAWNQLKRAYDAEELDEEPLKPKGSYVWHVRPEYQFSQLALEIQKIEREYTTESGETKTQELLIEQNEEGKIPTIRANDDLVRVFYSLIGNSNNPLLPIDGEQELVFGFGASEVRATIGANGEIVFKDLSHIDSLDPTDLLTLRLYVNHDAGNTLWEWAFTRNGLHVYYQIPGNTQLEKQRSLQNISDGKCSNNVCEDIEMLSLLAPEDKGYQAVTPPNALPEAKVRTLGGMRLRYRYIAPSLQGVILKKVTWTIGYKGRYCPDYGLDTTNCKDRDAGQAYEQEASFILPGITPTITTYWEPLNGDDKPDWSHWAGTQTDDKGISALLEAEYTVPTNSINSSGGVISVPSLRRFKQPFTVNTRELKPATGTEKPMEGSDVAMLEAMLWQLGISPQYGFPGSQGSRIDEIAEIALRKPKNQYSSGWNLNSDLRSKDEKDEPIPANVTAKRTASLEMMVRRFKGRHLYSEVGTGQLAAGKEETGDVDDPTLEKLSVLWQKYQPATKSKPEDIVLTQNSPALAAAVSVWESGLGDNVPKSYTTEIHQTVLAASGDSAGAFTREKLLFNWAQRESGNAPTHWKKYRIQEGGGDEFASYSYSQVKFYYIFGTPGTAAHKNNGLNYFDPNDNLKGFIVHTASKGGGITGGFYRAFSKQDLVRKYSTANQLRGFRHCKSNCSTTAITPINAEKQDDNYELLARAITFYHKPTNATVRSWPDMLVAQAPGCKLCGPEYALDIRINRFGLTPRQYIWKGGVEPATLPVLDAQGNQVEIDGVKQTIANPKAGQDWCFAYGEAEWLKPDKDADKNLMKWLDYKNDAKNPNSIYRTACN